jgi:phage terminase large subunit-like protein
MTRAEARAVLDDLARCTPAERLRVLRRLPPPALRAFCEEWPLRAHDGQDPDGDPNALPWRVWAIVAGRGFGKTRAGAEWIWARARETPQARIALVAASLDEVERVMVRGESGLLACARCDERPRWIASRGLLRFPSGAEAHAFSAEKPDKLRGPQHHFAWCDELAKWPNADDTWHNLMLGMRLGARPRTVVTTTPKSLPLLRTILALPRCLVTGGHTIDNPHLPADFIDAVTGLYGGTRLGRQELEGVLLEDYEGTLWSRELIERARAPDLFAQRRRDAESQNDSRRGATLYSGPQVDGALPGSDEGHGPSASLRLCANQPSFSRIVIGLDPPASTGGDSCGIVVCGRDQDGVAHVLADLTAAGLSPEAWARRVADAATLFGASRVVAEKNQGRRHDRLRAARGGRRPAGAPRPGDAQQGGAGGADRAQVRDGAGEAGGVVPRAGGPDVRADLGGVSGRREPGPGGCHGVGDDGIVREGTGGAAGAGALTRPLPLPSVATDKNDATEFTA